MGKSRRYKHVDRNAHRFDRRDPAGASTLVRTIGNVAAPIEPKSDFRSRYPAKKGKRARRADPLALRSAVQAPTICQPLPSVPVAPLLLTYRPQCVVPIEDDWQGAFLAAPANDNRELWCGEFAEHMTALREAAAAKPAPIMAAPPADIALSAPLPRSAAITPWRRRNPLDVVALWLRAGWRAMRPWPTRPI